MHPSHLRVIVFACLILAPGAGTLLIAGNAWLHMPPSLVDSANSADEGALCRLTLNASACFWQDFMPIIPPEGPPFFLIVRIGVANPGRSTVYNLTAVWALVFFADTMKPLHAFPLVAVTPGLNSTAPGESVVLEFTNSRQEIFSPSLEEGTELCTVILFTWGHDQRAILETSPSPLQFTY